MGRLPTACCEDLVVNTPIMERSEVLDATATPKGAVYERCREDVIRALNKNAPCGTKNCTFNGVWNGGGGVGQANLYVTSFFHDKAGQCGFIDSKAPSAKSTPAAFKAEAEKACSLSVQEAKAAYPKVRDLPAICMHGPHLPVHIARGWFRFGANEGDYTGD